jgi:hypothetical protein
LVSTFESGPRQLVRQLVDWATATPWVDWVELGGSLGRGAGDDRSDVDAGLGIVGEGSIESLTASAMDVALSFAAPAAQLVQHLGTPDDPAEHLIVQYEDSRQLSLVLMPAASRTGLPPEAIAVVDKSGRLASSLPASRFGASPEQRHEWSFLAWIALGDAWKHANRGSVWRSIRSLGEARSFAFQLHAAEVGVRYPRFGEVSLENAGAPLPAGMEGTLPATLEPRDIHDAIHALAPILVRLTAPHDVDALRALTLARTGRLP